MLNIWPFCFSHPRVFMAFKALGRMVQTATRLLDLETGMWPQQGKRSCISPPKERHEGRRRGERSKQVRQQQEAREERQQENKTSPKISLVFPAPQTKAHTGKGFLRGEEALSSALSSAQSSASGSLGSHPCAEPGNGSRCAPGAVPAGLPLIGNAPNSA